MPHERSELFDAVKDGFVREILDNAKRAPPTTSRGKLKRALRNSMVHFFQLATGIFHHDTVERSESFRESSDPDKLVSNLKKAFTELSPDEAAYIYPS